MTCFCKRDIVEGERQIDVALDLNWNDERGEWSGVKSFCSFGCLASWAGEMSSKHDARLIVSPPAMFEPAEPVLDTQTTALIR